MPFYRKKPIVIEAVQFTGHNFYECAYFMGLGDLTGNDMIHPTDIPSIDTLEGKMTASKGDWIIRGVKGELYPCKDDIFKATYDMV